jgi:hypothetical protein
MYEYLCAKDLHFLLPVQREKLQCRFTKPIDVQPHELSYWLETEYKTALAVLMMMATLPVGSLYLLLYHYCDPNVYSLKYKLGEGRGLPDLPIRCKLCDEYIESYDNVFLDYSAQFSKGIKFDWRINGSDRT